jgi:hypothetical protein
MMKKIIIVLSFLVIGCQAKLPFHLGNHYYLDYDPNSYFALYDINDIDSGLARGIVLRGDILKINRNSKYIIALVKPVYKIIDQNNNLNYQEQKDLIEKCKIKEYWIVDNSMPYKEIFDKKKGIYFSPNVFGPYSKIEYLKKRKELLIPDTLKLITIKEFLSY